MKKNCPHCNKEIEYEKHQQFGGHITNCKMNPKRNDMYVKRSKTQYSKHKLYNLKCINCGNDYILELTEHLYNIGKYKKCCCSECAHKYSQSFVNNEKTKDAKCKICGDDMKIKLNASNKNCICKKCTNININNLKIKNGSIKSKEIIDGKIICKICGSVKCNQPEICYAWIHGRSKIFHKLGFDESKIGTELFYTEYNRIVELLKTEYENNSTIELQEKFKINHQTFYMLFKSLDIKSRNNSESNLLAFKKGRTTISEVPIYPYKSGYHTSWEGKTFWLRSSYELEYAKELDKNKIRYDVEKIRLQYFDTETNTERTAVPDFYLIDTNELVEIKSSWTYKEQEMNDKIKSYKENGYRIKLLLDKKEI